MIEDFIKENKETMIKKLQELIQIPSVYSESKNPLMPFGVNLLDLELKILMVIVAI